jgi:drug/metabolite transporter (DMT)-like permease
MMRDLQTPILFVLSAALYGAMPIAYVLAGEGEAARTAAFAVLLVSAAPLLLLSSRSFRAVLFRSCRDLPLLGLAALNLISFLASLQLMFLALERGEAGMAAVLIEVWPVFQVWILALLMRDRRGLGPFRTGLLGAGGVFGVIYLSHDGQAVPLMPVLFGLGSALMMGVAASIKVLAVLRMRDRHRAGPLQSTLLLTLLGLPAAVLMAAPHLGSAGLGAAGGGAALLIAALSFSSSLAATLGTYKMRDVSAFLLFLLTPVFGLIFLGLIGEVKLGPSGPFGVVILLALNALALLPRPAPRSA